MSSPSSSPLKANYHSRPGSRDSHTSESSHTSVSSTSSRSRPSQARGDFSKRTIKANPLFSGADKAEARRKLFLQKGKDKRWEKRGGDEEVLRGLWVCEERRRRWVMEREMSVSSDIPEEEEEGMDGMNEEERLLELVEREEQEVMGGMEETIDEGLMEGEEGERYGSDEDEYDDIFLSVAAEEACSFGTGHNVGLVAGTMQHQGQHQSQQQHDVGANDGDQDMMDMS